MGRIEEDWGGLGRIGEDWGGLGRVEEDWRGLGRIGEDWGSSKKLGEMVKKSIRRVSQNGWKRLEESMEALGIFLKTGKSGSFCGEVESLMEGGARLEFEKIK